MDRNTFVFASLLLIASVGCNSSSGPGESEKPAGGAAASGQSTSAGGSATKPQMGATPDKAVAEFLDAVRSGNEELADEMLTPTARQRTSEAGLAVAPPGRPTAKFTVSTVEYVTDDKKGAHVWSHWTDVGPDGNESVDEIIWVLRQEAVGWRIVGSITKVFDDREPLVLNFEDPEDMKRKLEMLFQEQFGPETTGAEPAGQPQATLPDASAPATR